MKRTTLFPILLLAICLTACGGLTQQSGSSASAPMQAVTNESASVAATTAPAAAEAPALAGGAAYPTTDQQVQQAPQGQSAQARLVIKNADLSITVSDVGQAETAVRTLAEQMGGYVVKTQNNGTGDNQTTQLTFRVPSTRFDDALTGVTGLAKEVTSRTISGDDVTEEFVDLDSRLRNLEATRDRLLTFLDKATKVEDALSVNQALSDVQGQIEQIRGRMQYLKQSASLSTISVVLYPVPITPIVPEGSWQPIEVARNALQGLIGLGQSLVNALIVILVWTPLWLPLLLIGRWLIRKRRPTVTSPPSTVEG